MPLSIFPELMGLKFDLMMIPQFNTGMSTSSSGKEVRTEYQAYPLWDYELSYEWLPNGGGGREDLQTILGFFLERKGSFETFLYKAPETPYENNILIGIGDGIETTFRLLRSIGNFVEPAGGVEEAIDVDLALNGVSVLPADFTLSDHRDIIFDVAPTAGVEITASFFPLLRVRFKENSVDFNQFSSRLWEIQSLSLRSVL